MHARITVVIARVIAQLAGSVTLRGLPSPCFDFFGGGGPIGDYRDDRGNGPCARAKKLVMLVAMVTSKCNDISNFASLFMFCSQRILRHLIIDFSDAKKTTTV